MADVVVTHPADRSLTSDDRSSQSGSRRSGGPRPEDGKIGARPADDVATWRVRARQSAGRWGPASQALGSVASSTRISFFRRSGPRRVGHSAWTGPHPAPERPEKKSLFPTRGAEVSLSVWSADWCLIPGQVPRQFSVASWVSLRAMRSIIARWIMASERCGCLS